VSAARAFRMPLAGKQFEYGFDDIGNRNAAATGRDT